MLNDKQRWELTEYIFQNRKQSVISNSISSAYIDKPLTEIREGNLYFCLEERKVSVQGDKVDLSAREFNALHLLISNPNRVMTFEIIFCHVWGEEYVENELTAIHNIMSRLRQKLRINPNVPDYIKNVRGVGYKFESE